MDDTNQENHQPKTLKPEDIVAMKKLSGAAISPDGRWAVFVRSVPVLEKDKSEYRSHIWLVPTDGENPPYPWKKGGEPLQLTNGPNGDTGPQWSPDSTRIAFVSKRTGDKSQIWIVPVAGGEARQLTYTKNGASTPRWSPDGERIAFLMQEKDSEAEEKRKKAKDDPVVVEKDDFKQTHLWVIDVETLGEEPELLFTLPEKESDKDGKKDESERKEEQDERDKSKRLTEGDFHVSDPWWSPDGKQIAFVSAPSPKADHSMFNATIQIIDVETKAIRKLTSYDGGEGAPRWSPDGKWLAFLYRTDDANHLQKDINIIPIPAEGGTLTNLTSDFDHNEVAPIWSPNGEMIYFEAADRVRRHLYAVPKDGGEVRQITYGDCVIGGMTIADDGDTYLCHRATANTPMDLWVGSIRTGRLEQITKLNPQLADFALGETRVLQWQNSDGFEIEGLLCLPVDYEEGKNPLIVAPHGGPHGAIALGFNPAWQYFSGEGFATFAPNFRGSDGYGRDFARGNYRNWGIADYQDIMAGVDHLIGQGIADPDRMVVGGWSYGGYMTAWIVTQTDRFKAASNGAGLSNLVSMYAQNDIPSYLELFFEDSSPYQKVELYRKHSPISYIHQVKTPTLILHGAEDKRVPVPQAEEFYAGLKAIGVDVEFVKYPREGHGIEEPRHILDLLKRRLAWYKKYVM
jgi:dipeptidyl aminopeptidase/acylaminoacyl peptidase